MTSAFVGLIIALGTLIGWSLLKRHGGSQIHSLDGPKAAHWLLGNLKQLMEGRTGEWTFKWFQTYGDTFRIHGMFGKSAVMTRDSSAISYIFSHPDILPRTKMGLQSSRVLTGDSVMATEGQVHARMRRALVPSFSRDSIRMVSPLIFQKAKQLVRVLEARRRTDTADTISRFSLDVIGLIALDIDWDNLAEGPPNDLVKAWTDMMEASTDRSIGSILSFTAPGLARYLPKSIMQKKFENAKEVMSAEGRSIISQRRHELASSTGPSAPRYDVLTALLSQRDSEESATNLLSDEEIWPQIPAMILAGSVTTTSALTWALYLLAKHKDVQVKLQEECQLVDSGLDDYETIDSLTFLDDFVTEVLRITTPIPMTSRRAKSNVSIPLSSPITDRSGRTRPNIELRKGDTIYVSMASANDDAYAADVDQKFDPRRQSSNVKSISGGWKGQGTFAGGGRACLGINLAVAEIKIVVFTILCAISIEPSTTAEVFNHGEIGLARPKALGEDDFKIFLEFCPHLSDGNT